MTAAPREALLALSRPLCCFRKRDPRRHTVLRNNLVPLPTKPRACGAKPHRRSAQSRRSLIEGVGRTARAASATALRAAPIVATRRHRLDAHAAFREGQLCRPAERTWRTRDARGEDTTAQRAWRAHSRHRQSYILNYTSQRPVFTITRCISHALDP